MPEIKYPLTPTVPTAHHTSHEPGGTDEVFGIPAAPHQASHVSGADQIPDATGAGRGLMSALQAGKLNAQFFIDPNMVHADKNRVDIYVEDGSPTFPFKTIQGAVVHAEDVMGASAANPVTVLVEPGDYAENVVVHKAGVFLKGRGPVRSTVISPATGAGITLTNATALSLGAYDLSGTYSDLVNQGDAGPVRNGIDELSISPAAGIPIRLLGVQGDSGAGTTDFGLDIRIGRSLLSAAPGFPPILVRNAGAVEFDTEFQVSGLSPLTLVNVDVCNLSNAVLQGNLSADWDSADPDGTPTSTANKRVSGKNVELDGVDLSGEAKVAGLSGWLALGNISLTGTSSFEAGNGIVEGNINAGAGCSFEVVGTDVGGNLVLDVAAAASTMAGGMLTGTVTDPGSKLTRTFSRHQTEHVSGSDQIPNATALTKGLMTTAQAVIVAGVPAHAHTGADGTGKLAQINTHQSPDTDVAPSSLHHTIGSGANQAAAGNHDHSGRVPGTEDLFAPAVGTATVVDPEKSSQVLRWKASVWDTDAGAAQDVWMRASVKGISSADPLPRLVVERSLDGAVWETEIQWDDLRMVPGAFSFGGTADPTLSPWTPGGSGTDFLVYAFQNNDEAFFTAQLPHSYKQGSDLYVHLHWSPRNRGVVESGRSVGWMVDYSVMSVAGVFSPSTTVNLSDSCSGVNDAHEVTSSILIPGAGLKISAMILGRVYRSGGSWVGTTAAQSPILLEVDFHFQMDSAGSDRQFIKGF